MNWEALGAIAETVGGLGVILTLVYLAMQIRASNRVASAQSRQSMTQFVMQITSFRAEHAERYAKIASGQELSPGDREFLYWSHMQMLSYGEAYFQQHKLGLVTDSHWQGFSNWLDVYVTDREFVVFWQKNRSSFSRDYSDWISAKLPG